MNTLVTNASPRYDAFDKVTGKATYTEDLPEPPGTLFGRILLSPYSHARITAIDASKAEKLPGVFAVLTSKHLGDMKPYPRDIGVEMGVGRLPSQPIQPHQPFIATDKVRFDGEPVAAVAAETMAIADRAIELIDVEYEELPVVFDPREAVKPNAPSLHESNGSNIIGEFNLNWGDVEKGFQEADEVFEGTYIFPTVFHHPMENLGTCVAQFVNDEIILTAPIQHIFSAREDICAVFGLEPEQVRIRMPYIGGGFGAKELKPSMFCALWLARQTNRPVKMIPSTEESFRNDARHCVVFNAKTGVKSDGTIVALEVDALVDAGAYATVSLGTARMVGMASWGPYRTPNLRVHSTSVYTNKVPAGLFRGVGKAQATWGCESNIDAVARAMNIDPTDFRIKNVIRQGELFVKGAIPL
ncbi:molybdopterin-dependent oxidoreductase, partial [Dehalococcoidia bacterium]|nr:molybdopterin-dependent oxidoreductase [Dehalococcoidia bacterium]